MQVFDNWSVVDSFCSSLKSVGKNKEIYFNFIKNCLKDANDFVVRFAIILIMDYYLNEQNLCEVLAVALSGQRDSYYIQMGLAWLFATSVAKNFEETIIFLNSNKSKLSLFTKQKIISKCNDSFRISKQQKEIVKHTLIG